MATFLEIVLLVVCGLLIKRYFFETEPLSSSPDEFTEDQWNTFARRSAVLRAWGADGRNPHKVLFAVRTGKLRDVCQPLNEMVEGDVSKTEARSKNVSQSLGTDKGGHLGAGGGVPGGQGIVDVALAKTMAVNAASARAGQKEEERHRSEYTALKLFFNADWLELSEDCKNFFVGHAAPPTRPLDTLLKKFQQDFGVCFYRTVELGVSREKISASKRENVSQTSDEDRTRQIQLEATGQGPYAHAGTGLHRNVDQHVGGSSVASKGSEDSVQYSYGGAAHLAHVDDSAWRTALRDPTSWVVLEGGRWDPVSCLQLVQEIAEREARACASSDMEIVRNQSLALINYASDIEKRNQEIMRQKALDASLRTICVDFKMDKKLIVVKAARNESIATIEATVDVKETTHQLLMEQSDSEILRQIKLPGRPSSYPVVIKALCTFAPGWSPSDSKIQGGIAEYARSNELSVAPSIMSVDFGGWSSSKQIIIRQHSWVTTSPPVCHMTVLLTPATHHAVALLQVRNESSFQLNAGNPVLHSPRGTTEFEDAPSAQA